MELSDRQEVVQINVEKPKKMLYFSDGPMEVSSSDDEDENDGKTEQKEKLNIDESQLTWGPWLALKGWQTGEALLSGCDYIGGTLASILGISTPKFNAELEYQKAMDEKRRIEDEDQSERIDTGGWTQKEVPETVGKDKF